MRVPPPPRVVAPPSCVPGSARARCLCGRVAPLSLPPHLPPTVVCADGGQPSVPQTVRQCAWRPLFVCWAPRPPTSSWPPPISSASSRAARGTGAPSRRSPSRGLSRAPLRPSPPRSSPLFSPPPGNASVVVGPLRSFVAQLFSWCSCRSVRLARPAWAVPSLPAPPRLPFLLSPPSCAAAVLACACGVSPCGVLPSRGALLVSGRLPLRARSCSGGGAWPVPPCVVLLAPPARVPSAGVRCGVSVCSSLLRLSLLLPCSPSLRAPERACAGVLLWPALLPPGLCSLLLLAFALPLPAWCWSCPWPLRPLCAFLALLVRSPSPGGGVAPVGRAWLPPLAFFGTLYLGRPPGYTTAPFS